MRPPDDREHAHELAEDEDLVPALDRRLHELAQRHELARVVVAELARQPEQARIARRLPQPREAREDLDVAARQTAALDLAHDLRPDLLEDRGVEGRLLAGELAELSVSIFSGRSFATSDFVRRRMNGWMVARRRSAAFLSPPSMGRE